MEGEKKKKKRKRIKHHNEHHTRFSSDSIFNFAVLRRTLRREEKTGDKEERKRKDINVRGKELNLYNRTPVRLDKKK